MAKQFNNPSQITNTQNVQGVPISINLITPHAAVALTCEDPLFTALPTSQNPEKYSVGLILIPPGENNSTSLFAIYEVFYYPGDEPMFETQPVFGSIVQQPKQFFRQAANMDKYILVNNPAKAFSDIEFTNKIDANFPLHLVFFPRNELEPMLKISSTLIVSGSTIKFGKVAWQHEDDWVDTDREYFTLKAEVNLEIDTEYFNGQTGANLTGSQSGTMSIPLVSTGQPCPPRWDTFGAALASLAIKPNVYNSIISDPVLAGKVLTAWYKDIIDGDHKLI